ncbi:hypothetical protein KBD18_02735 [Patescibacteria group bacterium]|nr:hypothetical protein [Patescibacteria group bacterium]
MMELKQFVADSLKEGSTRKEVADVLEKAGWEPGEVAEALDAYADIPFVIPVPKRKPYLSAREAFLYLLLFLTLYISAYSFGALLFNYINRAFPDALLQYDNGSSQAIRSSLAALIVAFPIFFFLSTYLARAMRRHAEKKASKIRKWLTYITLFIAAGVIIGDLITLITSVLGGELTTRFDLKVLTVLAIAGSIFGYYLWDLRREEKDV